MNRRALLLALTSAVAAPSAALSAPVVPAAFAEIRYFTRDNATIRRVGDPGAVDELRGLEEICRMPPDGGHDMEPFRTWWRSL